MFLLEFFKNICHRNTLSDYLIAFPVTVLSNQSVIINEQFPRKTTSKDLNRDVSDFKSFFSVFPKTCSLRILTFLGPIFQSRSG